MCVFGVITIFIMSFKSTMRTSTQFHQKFARDDAEQRAMFLFIKIYGMRARETVCFLDERAHIWSVERLSYAAAPAHECACLTRLMDQSRIGRMLRAFPTGCTKCGNEQGGGAERAEFFVQVPGGHPVLIRLGSAPIRLYRPVAYDDLESFGMYSLCSRVVRNSLDIMLPLLLF